MSDLVNLRVKRSGAEETFSGEGPFGYKIRTIQNEKPWYLHPDKLIWDPSTKLPKAKDAPNPNEMGHEAIFNWVEATLPLLDAPEVLIPEMNCTVRNWEKADSDGRKCKLLITTPVEYSAAIANMGVAIIYDICNTRNPAVVLAERAYYPEPKLRTKMLKKRIPLFSKETRHQVKDFDIVAFSSYYPLQMLAFPDLLEMAGMEVYAEDRKESDPLVGLAGVSAFNPEPVFNVVDFVAIGEGENQVLDMVRIWNEEKAKEQNYLKDRVLLRWATEVDGIYVPKYYEEEYYPTEGCQLPGTLKEHRVREEFENLTAPNGKKIPKRIKKAIIDVNEVKPLTSMLVSNSEGEAMSAGSLMIANSCSNSCSFCQGSFISKPYRERDLGVVKAGFSQLIKDTGAHAVTPYAFNLSDHSKVNEIVYYLLSDEDRKVSMSSQRIDYFSRDFAKAAFLSGNKSITLAIEGGSQRMRDVVSKNLTESIILEAFRTVFEIGFLRVKIYMIANLPGETVEDRRAIVDLLRKIAAIQKEVQGDSRTTQIRVSYTPFSAKNCTPFQWAPGLECIRETGLPVVERNLASVIDEVHDVGYKFRVGTNSDLSIVNQLITLGDRRLAPVLMAIYRSPSLNYAGGMSIGKNPVEEVQKYLWNIGLDYEYYMREKHTDEVFPWDFINTRVTKNYLLALWERAIHEQNTPICFDECTSCAACTKDTLDYFKARQSGKLEPDRLTVADALNFKVKPVLQKLRLKIRVSDRYRFVHGSKIKMRLRRAAIRLGLPIKQEFTLASDKIVYQNWLAGVDYAEVALHSRVFEDTETLATKLTEMCNENPNDPVLQVLECRVMSSNAANFRNSFEKIVYKVSIPSAVVDNATIESLFSEVLNSKSFIIKVKTKGMMRDSWIVVEYEARPHIHSLVAVRTETGSDLFMVLSDKVGPYELLPAVFKTSKRNLLQFTARRVELLEKSVEGEQSMLDDFCEESGQQIENNLFGEPLSSTHCARFIHLAQDVVG